MWDVNVPVVGQCRTCGANLATCVRVRATPEWAARYRSDEQLRRRTERAVVQRVIDQHTHNCAGRRRRYAVAS